jgi:Holliday junction resolvasome RuvABC endonuclease subunit
MNIISIDSSKSNTGIYIKSKHEHYTTICTTKLKTEKEKYIFIHDEFRKLCEKHQIEIAFLEDYAFSRFGNSSSVSSSGEVKGIIMYILYSLSIPVIKVSPTTWKMLSRLALPKKKNKKYVADVNTFYRKTFSTPDECDAYMMLLSMFYIWQGLIKTDSHLKYKKQMSNIGDIFGE